MIKTFSTLMTILLALTAFVPAARADYIVWEDPKSGMTLSYPDTWRMGSQRQPDEIISLIAPSTARNDDAVCRARVREDKRFLIYPPHLAGDVQPIAYSENFWRDYLGEYDDVKLYGFTDGSGMGRGFGSFAVAGYDAALFSAHTKRRGIAAASLYFDKLYVVDCSAHADVFEEWQPLFLSIIGSVDFKKAHHELRTGHYRNFLADPHLVLKWPLKDAVNRY